MKRPSSFQIRKLERQIEATGARELKHRLEVAQARVNRRIASMARDPKAATSKRYRDALEAEITRIYASLSLDFDKWLGDIVKTGGPAWAGETAGQIMQATGKKLPLMRFDRERVQRYQEMIAKENGEHLAAVFTRSMTDASIRQLRNATVDTFRQQVIEGWSANETHKRLQQSWDRLAGNESGRRFVDRGGKEWTNSRYLQMLTRTTMQRVSREIEIDTLAENGFSLAQISSDAGDPCPICEAWEGVIIQLAGSGIGGGRYPTYQQTLDAGMFHPNCVHRVEYIDEDLEGAEIQRQSEEPSPGNWDDPDAVLDYRNRIEIHRYRDQGMSVQEATRAVMRDRLKRRAQSGMISNRFEDAIDAIPDRVLDQMNLNKLPHFRYMKSDEDHAYSRNSSRGGWIVLDRDAGSEDGGRAAFDKAFYSLETKRGVLTSVLKNDKSENMLTANELTTSIGMLKNGKVVVAPRNQEKRLYIKEETTSLVRADHDNQIKQLGDRVVSVKTVSGVRYAEIKKQSWMSVKAWEEKTGKRFLFDESNFHINTIAEFKPADKPKRKPDFVSEAASGGDDSKYWYTKDGVIRSADHWGNFASVQWNCQSDVGFCKWEDFRSR